MARNTSRVTNNWSHEYSWRIVLYTYRSVKDDRTVESKDFSLEVTSIVLFGCLGNVKLRDLFTVLKVGLTSRKADKESADVTVKESGSH